MLSAGFSPTCSLATRFCHSASKVKNKGLVLTVQPALANHGRQTLHWFEDWMHFGCFNVMLRPPQPLYVHLAYERTGVALMCYMVLFTDVERNSATDNTYSPAWRALL
jgi:hypothetical protein